MRREEEDVTSPGKFIAPGVHDRRAEKAPVHQDQRKKARYLHSPPKA
jgi:hypothetical protein